MVWPVNMRYEKCKDSNEVQLTVIDFGLDRSTDNDPHATSERTILMRFYKSPAEALAALIKPNNGLAKAMWDCYSSEYEISDLTIQVNNDYISLDDEYCDDECVNIVLSDAVISELTELFEFKEPDVFTVNVPMQYSRSKVLELAKAAMKDTPIASDDVIISEFIGCIECSTSANDLPEIETVIEQLVNCGAIDAVNHN